MKFAVIVECFKLLKAILKVFRFRIARVFVLI